MNHFQPQMHMNPYMQNANPELDNMRHCCGQQMGNQQMPFQGPFGSFETNPNAFGPGPATNFGPEQSFPQSMPSTMDPFAQHTPQMGPPMMAPLGNPNNFPSAGWQHPGNQGQPMMNMGCGCGHHHAPHSCGCGCGHHGHGAHHHHMQMGPGPGFMGR